MRAGAVGQHETDPGRGRVRLLGVVALLFALLVAFAPLPAPAGAAPNVRIVAAANFGGAFRAGAWVPITVTLANDGAAVTGEVVAQTDGGGGGGRYFQRVELPTRSQKALVLYVLATDTARNVRVTFTSGQDVVPAPPVGLTLLRAGQQLIGVAGDDARASGEIVRALFGIYGNGVEAIAVAPGDVPDNPYGLGSFAALVLSDAATGRWSPEQRAALAGWVGRGGRLIVAGGPNWRKTIEGVGDLSPIRPVDSRTVGGLGGLAGSGGGPAGSFVVSVGEPVAGATKLAEGDGVPLVARHNWGRGEVTYLAFDPAAPGFLGWSGAGGFWRGLGLGTAAPASLQDPFLTLGVGPGASGGPNVGQGISFVNRVVEDVPGLGLPPTWLLGLVMLLFIIAVGPLNYLLLRRLDRRELAWLTIPALTLLFAAGIYAVGVGTRGRGVIVNTVSIVRIAPGARAAEAQSFYGVVAPSRGNRQLGLRQGEGALLTGFSAQGLGEGDLGDDVRFEQGAGAGARDAYFAQWTLRSVAAQATVDPAPLALRVELRRAGSKVTGQITNASGRPVEDVTLLLDDAYMRLGSLAPGASLPVDWTPTKATASGGYYQRRLGSDLYNTGYVSRSGDLTPEERRGQILDALTGSVLDYSPPRAGTPGGPAAPTPTPRAMRTPARTPTPGGAAAPPASGAAGSASGPLQVLFWRTDTPLALDIGAADREATTLVIQETTLDAGGRAEGDADPALAVVGGGR
jgi:hypothetical protein